MRQPRGIRNNNPGNIRISRSPWQGKVDRQHNTDGSFEQFTSMEYGIRALLITLRSYFYKHGKDTITKIIGRWAPTNENDTAAYVASVANRSGIGPNDKVTFNEGQIGKIAEAICFHENGGSYVTMEQIDKAWKLL